MEPLVAALQEGKPARTAIPPGEEEAVKRLQLLTSKPVLYVCNVEEASAATGNAFSDRVRATGRPDHRGVAAIEAEVSQLPEADRREFLETLGLSQSGLDQVIRAGYELLELVTYFTCGPKETRAWTITKGTRAPQAAAVIHKDFERGFIACETIAYADFVAWRRRAGCQGGWPNAGGRQDLCRQGWRRAACSVSTCRYRPRVPYRVLGSTNVMPPGPMTKWWAGEGIEPSDLTLIKRALYR